jgi:hypothetical protein
MGMAAKLTSKTTPRINGPLSPKRCKLQIINQTAAIMQAPTTTNDICATVLNAPLLPPTPSLPARDVTIIEMHPKALPRKSEQEYPRISIECAASRVRPSRGAARMTENVMIPATAAVTKSVFARRL